jgi:hypothetical protein
MFFPPGDMLGVAVVLDSPKQTPTKSVAEISNAYKVAFFIIYISPFF